MLLGVGLGLPPHVVEMQAFQEYIKTLDQGALDNLKRQLKAEWDRFEAQKKNLLAQNKKKEVAEANRQISFLKLKISYIAQVYKKAPKGTPAPKPTPIPEPKPILHGKPNAYENCLKLQQQGFKIGCIPPGGETRPPGPVTDPWEKYALCLQKQERGAKIKCIPPGGDFEMPDFQMPEFQPDKWELPEYDASEFAIDFSKLPFYGDGGFDVYSQPTGADFKLTMPEMEQQVAAPEMPPPPRTRPSYSAGAPMALQPRPIARMRPEPFEVPEAPAPDMDPAAAAPEMAVEREAKAKTEFALPKDKKTWLIAAAIVGAAIVLWK